MPPHLVVLMLFIDTTFSDCHHAFNDKVELYSSFKDFQADTDIPAFRVKEVGLVIMTRNKASNLSKCADTVRFSECGEGSSRSSSQLHSLLFGCV